MLDKVAIIYRTTNLINGKIYVGQSCFPKNTRYLGSGIYLEHAVEKYGVKNFCKEIIEWCTLEELDEREIYWIAKLDSRNPVVGYNLNIGGAGGRLGAKLREETKRAIGLKSKDRKWSAEARKRRSEYLKEHPRAEWHMTEEQKNYLAILKKGIPLTEAHRLKLVEAAKLHPWTEERRQRQSELMRLRIVKDETRQLLSVINKGRVYKEAWRQNLSIAKKGKPHRVVETYLYRVRDAQGIEYRNIESFKVFCEKHNLNYGSIVTILVRRMPCIYKGWVIERQRKIKFAQVA